MQDYLIGGAIGTAVGLGLFYLYGFLLKRDAKSQADSILDDAKKEAESKVKETELKVKEIELKNKSKFEKEKSEFHDEIRKKEQSLDKREIQLTQQAEGLRKQESMVQVNQNKLKLKLEQADKHATDLHEIFEKQRKKLHGQGEH